VHFIFAILSSATYSVPARSHLRPQAHVLRAEGDAGEGDPGLPAADRLAHAGHIEVVVQAKGVAMSRHFSTRFLPGRRYFKICDGRDEVGFSPSTFRRATERATDAAQRCQVNRSRLALGSTVPGLVASNPILQEASIMELFLFTPSVFPGFCVVSKSCLPRTDCANSKFMALV